MKKDKITSLLAYSVENVPYYCQLYNAHKIDSVNIECFPVIDKGDIQNNFDSFISNNIINEKYLSFYTSGSTGNALKVYKNYNTYLMQLKNLWKFRTNNYNIKPSDRQLEFVFSNCEDFIIKQEKNSLLINVKCLTLQHISKIYNEIINFAPRLIIGYVSLILLFLNILEQLKFVFPKSIVYIELLGEYVFDFQRSYIEKVTGLKVVNSYGMTEVYGLAIECSQGNMHCLDDNAYIEILDKDGKKCKEGQVGEIVVTVYDSYVMPFIRYRTGDYGIMHPEMACKCGKKSRMLEIKAGRIYDYILCKDSRIIHAGFLYGVIESINNKFNRCILQFEIIQKEIDLFYTKIYIKNEAVDLSDDIKKMLIIGAKSIGFKDSKWNIDILFGDSFIGKEKKGKNKFFCRQF